MKSEYNEVMCKENGGDEQNENPPFTYIEYRDGMYRTDLKAWEEGVPTRAWNGRVEALRKDLANTETRIKALKSGIT